MKNISRGLARDVARKLTENIKTKIDTKTEWLEEYCKGVYYSQISKDIMEHILAIPKRYLNTKSYCYYTSHGCGTICISFHDEIFGSSDSILIERDIYDTIEKTRRDINELGRKRDILIVKIEESLYKMRTFNKIKTDFPEAYAFIPEDALNSENLPAVQIKDILSEINTCN